MITALNLVEPVLLLRLNEGNVRKGNWVDPGWKFWLWGSCVIGLNHTDS